MRKLHRDLIDASLSNAIKIDNGTGWSQRHADVWLYRSHPIVGMISAAASYADEHSRRYESGIGDDGVLGLEWAQIIRSIRGLLNEQLGNLDGGTLDALLLDMLRLEGFDENGVHIAR